MQIHVAMLTARQLEKYKNDVFERFKTGFSKLGSVHMTQVRQQIEDGTLTDSKLTKEEYLQIWRDALAWKADIDFKASAKLAAKKDKLKAEREADHLDKAQHDW